MMLGALLLLSIDCYSQPGCGVWGELEGGLGFSFGHTDKYAPVVPSGNSVSTLNVTLGYRFTPVFSLGITSGITGYLNPGLNFVPLMLDLRVVPRESRFLVNARAGTQLLINEDVFRRGFNGEINVGYNLIHRGVFTVTPCVGYALLVYSQGMNNAILFKFKVAINDKS